MSISRQRVPQLPIPPGTWRVGREQSEVGFAVKDMWGLRTVRGIFRTFDGELSVAGGGADGHLKIDATRLDTGNARRDRHLRSAAFFDVERYQVIAFTTTAVAALERGLLVTGGLTLGPAWVELQIPVEVERGADGAIVLRGGASVAREAVGLDWNMLGMIRGEAQLYARLVLTPAIS
jgi:polyisoprenoid-binding protein YceI